MSEHSTIAANQWHQGHIRALETQILTLAANINAAKYQWLKLLAEFDRLEGWCECDAIGSTANWLSFKCGVTPGAARENVRVARALTELPLINAAFKAGELSYSKVRAMTRAATPENEGFLNMIARHGTGAVTALDHDHRTVQPINGHSGGLDRSGCHHNWADGSGLYHCH